MKIHSKLVRSLAETKKYLLVLLPMMAMVLLPSFAHAKNERLYNIIFCRQFGNIKSSIIGKVNKTFADQLSTNEYQTIFDQNLKQRKLDIETQRAEYDGLIKSYILSIKNRTTNEKDKEILGKFEKEVDEILRSHRENIDTIYDNYEKELKDNAINQQEKIGNLVKDYRTKVESLLNDMSYKCKSPQDLGNYRSILKTNLKNLRQEIVNKEKEDGTLEETIKILSLKRDAHLMQENSIYNTKIDGAYQKLLNSIKK